jgi:hypothetical protein
MVFSACNLFNKNHTCEDEQIINVCVVGKYNQQDSIFFTREREKGIIDTAPTPVGPIENRKYCFDESRGKQRIIVYRNQARIDSSAWFVQKAMNSCNYEPKTITF